MEREELISFALSLPETVESAHLGTRDFRVRGKIFLTMPDRDYCVVRLTPDQQAMAFEIAPAEAMAVPGGWGERGFTRLLFTILPDALVEDLVRRAWSTLAPKALRQQLQDHPER